MDGHRRHCISKSLAAGSSPDAWCGGDRRPAHRRGSVGAVDGNGEGVADLTHPSVAQPADSVDKHCQRHASTESRLTAERRGTGSSPGSSTTSLTSPRIVVVHGAINTRRCRGITASRESTTTGRRPICGISHYHTSPRAGRAIKMRPRLVETMPGRPTRPARRAGARHRRCSLRLPRRRGGGRVERPEPRLRGPHR